MFSFFDRATGDIVCKTYWRNMAGCEGIILDVDSLHGENGAETITWNLGGLDSYLHFLTFLLSYFYPQFNKGTDDPYSYLLFINDYSQLGFSESEARISFYGGETVVKMEVEDGNNEDRWIWFQFALKLILLVFVNVQTHSMLSL